MTFPQGAQQDGCKNEGSVPRLVFQVLNENGQSAVFSPVESTLSMLRHIGGLHRESYNTTPYSVCRAL